ncbi:MAG: glycosyltransferase family 9 protein [Candidatus Omnitrophota bacterium]
MKIDKNNIKTILFITLSNLGDIILTTPVLEKLCDEFPGASVDVITGPAGRGLFSAHPRVRNVIVHKKRTSLKERLGFFLELRRGKYDLTVDLKNSLLPYILGARCRTSVLDLSVPGRHKKEGHLTKLLNLGLDAFSGTRFFLPVSEEERTSADGILSSNEGRKVVLMNPGAKSHLKRWDSGKFAKLADRLIEELDCSVLVCGNEDDRETVECFMASVTQPVINLCCRTSVGILSELMRKSSLVITNDSAPLHMASAVNAPTIAIFGPSDEKKYGPLADKSRVVKPVISCRPCEKALCEVGPDEGCISNVTVDEVFEAAKELLKRGDRHG